MIWKNGRTMALTAALTVAVAGGAGAASQIVRDIEVLAGPCAFCHGPGGASQGVIPAIAGRNRDDLRDRMLAFRAGVSDATATIMPRLMRGYSPAEIDQLADYFAGLPK